MTVHILSAKEKNVQKQYVPIMGTNTVTPKNVTITNLKPGREAPRNHPWESRFALVGPNIVQTLGYKLIPGSRDSAQGPPRYNSFKTGTPL